MEFYMEPKFLVGVAIFLVAVYLFFTIKIEDKVEESNKNAVRIHTDTYQKAEGLFELIEQEMRVKVANQIAVEKSEKIIELESHIRELEERKEELITQVGELERGEIHKLVEEIELTKARLDNIFLHVGDRLNPVINWIDRNKDGDIDKAKRHYREVKSEEEPNIKGIEKEIKRIKNQTNRINF